MTDIVGSGAAPPPYRDLGRAPEASPAGKTPPSAPVEFDFSQYLKDVAQLMGGKANGSIGTGGPAAPEIGPPRHDEAYEEDIAQLLNASITNNGITASLNSIKVSNTKLEEQAAASKKKLDDSIRASENAERRKGGFLNKFLKVLTKVGAFAGAIAGLAVAGFMLAGTGGLAAGPAALLALGAVGSLVSLASQISQECGGPALDAASLASVLKDTKAGAAGGHFIAGLAGVILLQGDGIGQIASGAAVAGGTGEEKAALVASIGTAIGGILLSLATGKVIGNAVKAAKLKELDKLDDVSKIAASASKGSKGASASEEAAKALTISEKAKAAADSATGQAVKNIFRFTDDVATMTVGTSSATKGSLDIETANIERDADKARADKQRTDANIQRIQHQLEDERDMMKKFIEMFEGVTSSIIAILSQAAESRSQINTTMARQAV